MVMTCFFLYHTHTHTHTPRHPLYTPCTPTCMIRSQQIYLYLFLNKYTSLSVVYFSVRNGCICSVYVVFQPLRLYKTKENSLQQLSILVHVYNQLYKILSCIAIGGFVNNLNKELFPWINLYEIQYSLC